MTKNEIIFVELNFFDTFEGNPPAAQNGSTFKLILLKIDSLNEENVIIDLLITCCQLISRIKIFIK
ncbi:hypothetical protein BpHYR1_013232 [Brachionus plicatilis]|uniref:Uncharacterized protein n=1 Tax=Brachionus plicatilis TaxID=10195 RepID=A0A3M7RSL0_BRAPC|nr:hypothetical protein BpHYR1_013232 [Brachionus plicatilis]